jgi:glycosyltransferase involved in cell wall biosynthesis
MSVAMNVPAPAISLIIPTRERADTLAATLRSALDQKSDAFEVLVSDNASEDDTAAVVAAVDDPRLRYVNTGRRLSMCDNYEFALERARGDYVIIIGDDDAVIPGALDYLIMRMRAQAQPSIYMWPLHVYDWPTQGQQARLSYLAPDQPEQTLALKDKGQTVVRLGGWKYYELPSAYHCAVPKRIFDDIRRRTGRVFHSTQPDVFTAMAIPAFADTAINLGRGITMNGRSARSNGLGFISSGARSNIDRFIREYGDYRFHPTLSPEISPRGNMIPDAILIAKDMFPELYGDVDFGYDAMLAYVCRLRFSSHLEVLAKAAAIRRSHPLNIGDFLRRSAVHEAAVVRRRVLNRLGAGTELHKNVPANIHDFVRRLARARRLPDQPCERAASV